MNRIKHTLYSLSGECTTVTQSMGQGSGKCCCLRQERGAGRGHKAQRRGASWPPLPLHISMWYSGHRRTPTHFHGGHDTSFQQQLFQIFTFIFLKGEGRKNWTSFDTCKKKKNSIKPNSKGKDGKRFVGHSQKPHAFVTGRVCTRNPRGTSISWTTVFSSTG